MRALTSLGVSHQEKDGQSSRKNCFFCGLLHFSCDGKSYDECACRFLSASQSKCILCDLCWRFFFFFLLHSCSSIKELAVEQFFLLHNCMTGASCSLAVMKRPICRVCFQRSKLVCLVLRLTWQIFGPWLIFTQRFILGTQFQFHFEYQVFPALDCKKGCVPAYKTSHVQFEFFIPNEFRYFIFLIRRNQFHVSGKRKESFSSYFYSILCNI